MTRTVIIGGGFAGLMAAGALARDGRTDVTLIDRKPTSDFLPLLPDAAAGNIEMSRISVPFSELSARLGFRYVQGEVTRIDRSRHLIDMGTQTVPFDYLIIAGGTETNFYGNRPAEEYAFPLNSSGDARRLWEATRAGTREHYVIVGGGYTGVEIATHLRRKLNRLQRGGRILMVEKAPSIAGALPPWMRDYIRGNLRRMNIEILESCELRTLSSREATLSTGETVENALTVWVAGVRAPRFVDTLELDRNPQGRLVVPHTLQVAERIFVAGDTALFQRKGIPLRMSVQFARTQGACAAGNVIRALAGRPLKAYAALDPGFVIPMANGRSCGRVFGVNLRGRLPTVLHYLLCAHRSIGWRRKWAIVTGR